jgi:CubicO group peptidase (beta-lactamase class C family)
MFRFEKKIDLLLGRKKLIHAVAVLTKSEELYSKTYLDYSDDELHAIHSVTKSITSLIAMKASVLSGVSMNTPILNTLNVKAKDSICYQMTVEEFINMRSGFDWEEIADFNSPNNPFKSFVNHQNPIEFLFNQRVIYTPDEVYNYNSALTHTLVYWIENVMNRPFEDLVCEWLFEPLGIYNYRWGKDKQGKPFGGHGLHLSFVDLKKIARLLVSEGKYLDTSILSKDMMKALKTITSSNIRGYKGYGYGMWQGEVNGSLFSAAFGHAGQRIYWFYELELAFVFLGKVSPEFGYQEKIISVYLDEQKNTR